MSLPLSTRSRCPAFTPAKAPQATDSPTQNAAIASVDDPDGQRETKTMVAAAAKMGNTQQRGCPTEGLSAVAEVTAANVLIKSNTRVSIGAR